MSSSFQIYKRLTMNLKMDDRKPITHIRKITILIQTFKMNFKL